MANPAYLKFYGRDLFIFTTNFKKSEKAAIFDAIIHLNMYGFWPENIKNLCEKSENFAKNFKKIEELFAKSLGNYNKICERNLKNSQMKSLKNKDNSNPVGNQAVTQVETHSFKHKQKKEAEENNIYTADKAADKPQPKQKQLNQLQVFAEEVIKNFEPDVKTKDQKEIWIKRNCRCLTDILKFCERNIPLAIKTIDVCLERMQKAGYSCGYEAVCRNLPEYFSVAKQKMGVEYAKAR